MVNAVVASVDAVIVEKVEELVDVTDGVAVVKVVDNVLEEVGELVDVTDIIVVVEVVGNILEDVVVVVVDLADSPSVIQNLALSKPPVFCCAADPCALTIRKTYVSLRLLPLII